MGQNPASLAAAAAVPYTCHMITIARTVDIPADRHLHLDLPQSVPSGRADIVLVLAAAEETPRAVTAEPFPSIEELKEEAAAKHAEMLKTGIDPLARFAGCLKDVFTEDGLEYQRRMRDEWPD
jgi:hypothetical protein